MRAAWSVLSITVFCSTVGCEQLGNKRELGAVDAATPRDAAVRHDAATRLDAAAPAGLHIRWDLETALMATGGTNNAFSLACDDPTARVTGLRFSVANDAGRVATTDAPCPAGATNGSVTLKLPDTTGPFTISAVALGQPASRSEKARHVTPSDVVRIRVFALGCDQPSCK